MELTNMEKAEFVELTKDSFDPELWLDEDLPFLREAKRKQRDEERARELNDILPSRNLP
jgi:hypothetical protein